MKTHKPVKPSNNTPSDYIKFAARNVEQIRIPEFEMMLERLFASVDERSTEAFHGFFAVAHTEGQERLLAPFHKIVRQGFERLKAGSPACTQPWGALFSGITDLIEKDVVLTRDVAERLLGAVIPHAIRNMQSKDTDWQMASDILQAAGKVPAIAEQVDPRLTHDILKWHMRQCGNDFIMAAARLTELRETPAFVHEIAAIENHVGVHVVAQPASIKTDRKDLTAHSRLLVLQFERAHDHVIALTLDPKHRSHPVEEIDLCGANTQYRSLWAEMLLKQYCEPPAEQAWVAPIAMNAYGALEV